MPIQRRLRRRRSPCCCCDLTTTPSPPARFNVLPAPEEAWVSPADFSHTPELIARGHRSAKRYLAAAPRGPQPAKLTLSAAAIQAA